MAFAQSEGAKIYYEEHGDGKPLLFIQGLGMSIHGSMNFIEAYKKKYRVIIADFRGTGKSEFSPGPYSVKQLAADYAAVLDSAGIDKAYVAGMSLGGHTAALLAVNYPKKVNKLVCSLSPGRTGELARARLKYWAELREKGMDEELIKGYFLWVFGEDFYADKARKEEWLGYAIKNGPPYSKETYVSIIEAACNYDLTGKENQIKCPALIIAGKRDLIFTVDEIREFAGKIDGAEFAVIDCAHIFIDDSFREFIKKTTEFFG